MTWKKITEKNTIVSGKGMEFEIDGKKIAVFNQNGYHALDDAENLQNNPSVQDNFNNIIQIFYEKFDVLKSLFIDSL